MFPQQDRNVYTFPGSGRVADPLELRRRLTMETRGELSSLIDKYNDGETELDRALAEDTLVAATRKAFDLSPITVDGGVTDATVLSYLAHYLEWLSTPSDLTINSRPTPRPCSGCK